MRGEDVVKRSGGRLIEGVPGAGRGGEIVMLA